ncbi:hypothetical protein, partial [Burkholderia cenocepacia]|uniref:hypothetical protein n=1 Tax=Burkholderia cenocepacia TaxID=95486 RepID=UPI003C12FCDA
ARPLRGPPPRRRLGRGRLHVRADGRQAAGRRGARVRFEQEARRPGQQERDDGAHRVSVPDAADPVERRHARDGPVDRLRAARRGAAHQPHVRAAVDPQARHPVRTRSRVAAARVVHRAHLPRGSLDRRTRAGSA